MAIHSMAIASMTHSPAAASPRSPDAGVRTVSSGSSQPRTIPRGVETFFVTCLFSFKPDDADQLPFRKGNILEVVHTEENGWWAAKHVASSRVGWVPRAFVKRISREAAMLQAATSPRPPRTAQLPSSATPTSPPEEGLAHGEILFRSLLSPTNITTAREFPTPVTPLTSHPFRTAATSPDSGVPSTSFAGAAGSSTAALRDQSSPSSSKGESTPIATPEKSASSSKSSARGLKVNTNLLRIPTPNLSPLTFADALDLSSPRRRADHSPDSPPSSETPSPIHPFASGSEWAAIPYEDSPLALSSANTSTPSSPPKAGQLHINIPGRPRASTEPIGAPKCVHKHAPSRSLQVTSPAGSLLARTRSKSALAVASLTATMSPSRPRVNFASNAADLPRRSPEIGHKALTPRVSAPDLRNVSDDGSFSLSRKNSVRRRQLDPLHEPSETSSGRSIERAQRNRGGSIKVLQLLGDYEASTFVENRERQNKLPWFLRPTYVEGKDIVLDTEDNVRAGAEAALMERLTVEPLKPGQAKKYLDVLLKTYPTFTTAEALFDYLEASYRSLPPTNLDDLELQLWREQKLWPAQQRILDVIRVWFEQHHLLEDDPQVASRAQYFLDGLKTSTAREILFVVDRLKGGPAPHLFPSPSQVTLSRKWGKQAITDVFKIDHTVLAQQLTLYEEQLYARLRPAECLRYSKGQKGDVIANLTAFCATSDKLAAWVKTSVLDLDALNKRADAVEYWIKVAAKCQQIGNISSLTAILAALGSVDVSRLARTWAEVSSARLYQTMEKMTDPNGNYTAIRQLLQSIEGPCIPFIAVYLRDLLHAHDAYPDTITRGQLSPTAGPSSAATSPGAALVNFAKRRTVASVIDSMLRHQNARYAFMPAPAIQSYIVDRFATASTKNADALYARSQDLRKAELTFGDIRRQMEWAGF